jgi:hypothetical protein
MFAKFLSSIFGESPESQIYTRLLSILRETLLPLGFSESQADIQASVTRQTIFQKGPEQIILANDLREREYAVLTHNVEQTPGQEGLPHLTLFSCGFQGFNEGSLFILRDELESWLKKIA